MDPIAFMHKVTPDRMILPVHGGVGQTNYQTCALASSCSRPRLDPSTVYMERTVSSQLIIDRINSLRQASSEQITRDRHPSIEAIHRPDLKSTWALGDDFTAATLPADQLRDAAAVAAAAFAESPGYVRLFAGGSAAERVRFLAWFMERNFWLRLRTRCNRAFFVGGELRGFFMFVTPDVPDVGLLDMLRAGMLMVPILFGFGVLARLLGLKAETEVEIAEITEHVKARLGPQAKLCQLERMCVTPAAQGRGFGSRCLQTALDEADARGWAVALTTQETRNVTFYERLGFEVVRVTERAPASSTRGPWPWSAVPFAPYTSRGMVRWPKPK